MSPAGLSSSSSSFTPFYSCSWKTASYQEPIATLITAHWYPSCVLFFCVHFFFPIFIHTHENIDSPPPSNAQPYEKNKIPCPNTHKKKKTMLVCNSSTPLHIDSVTVGVTPLLFIRWHDSQNTQSSSSFLLFSYWWMISILTLDSLFPFFFLPR